MECIINLDMDYGETCDFINRRFQRARKEHICCECHETIAIGEEYERTVGVWNGEFSAYKTCSPCVEVRDELFCDGYYFEQVWENIRESEFELNMSKLDDFTPTAQMKLIEKLVLERWDFLE